MSNYKMSNHRGFTGMPGTDSSGVNTRMLASGWTHEPNCANKQGEKRKSTSPAQTITRKIETMNVTEEKPLPHVATSMARWYLVCRVGHPSFDVSNQQFFKIANDPKAGPPTLECLAGLKNWHRIQVFVFISPRYTF